MRNLRYVRKHPTGLESRANDPSSLDTLSVLAHGARCAHASAS